MVLFSLLNPPWKENNNNQKSFQKQLGMVLIEPHLGESLTIINSQKTLSQEFLKFSKLKLLPQKSQFDKKS